MGDYFSTLLQGWGIIREWGFIGERGIIFNLPPGE